MKITSFAIALATLTFITSCQKDDENVISCLGESFLMDVHHSSETKTPFTVNFTFSYVGDHNMDSAIRWDFGDGNIESVIGTSTSHTYASTGSYTVKATPSLRKGSSSCSADITENVTIN